MVKSTPHQTNRFSVVETSTVGSTKDMLNQLSPVTIDPKTKQVMPEQPPLQPSEDPFFVQSTSLQRGTDIPLCLSTVDSNTPMFFKALVNSGATGMFIDIKFIRSKNIWTHRLPRAIPIDGTPNKAGHITEVIYLMVQYKDHSEWATFHITSFSQTTIILGHMWLMKHNPEIDWCMGDITMMRFPASFRPKTTEERDQLNHILADKTWRQLKAHLH